MHHANGKRRDFYSNRGYLRLSGQGRLANVSAYDRRTASEIERPPMTLLSAHFLAGWKGCVVTSGLPADLSAALLIVLRTAPLLVCASRPHMVGKAGR